MNLRDEYYRDRSRTNYNEDCRHCRGSGKCDCGDCGIPTIADSGMFRGSRMMEKGICKVCGGRGTKY
jgi:hypothetical protein